MAETPDITAATIGPFKDGGETKHWKCMTPEEMEGPQSARFTSADECPDKFCPECGRKLWDVPGAEDEVKRIPIKDFREAGYLHEVNRVFLHPLGLALEVVVAPSGEEFLGGVWDYRDDPHGMTYDPSYMRPEAARNVAGEYAVKAMLRIEELGYVVQPVEGVDNSLTLSVT